MGPSTQADSAWLADSSRCHQPAAGRLIALVCSGLHRLARLYTGKREGCLRLIDGRPIFGIASGLMGRIPAYSASVRPYGQRAGEARPVSLGKAVRIIERKSEESALRSFARLKLDKNAEVPKALTRRVLRGWPAAKFCLRREIRSGKALETS